MSSIHIFFNSIFYSKQRCTYVSNKTKKRRARYHTFRNRVTHTFKNDHKSPERKSNSGIKTPKNCTEVGTLICKVHTSHPSKRKSNEVLRYFYT